MISDRTAGGAAIACSRLLQGLRSETSLTCIWLSVYGTGASGAQIAPDRKSLPHIIAERVLERILRSRAQVLERVEKRMTFTGNERNVLTRLRRQEPGLINLHNLRNSLRFQFAESCTRLAPVVWTLHDMWPFTGYCCYSGNCLKYTDGCRGECPQMGRWGVALEAPDRAWHRRQRFFLRERSRVVLVTPSAWLKNLALARFAGKLRVEHIPYGVDTATFRPEVDRQALRRRLDLKTDGKLILFGADSVTDPRKGVTYLKEAVDILRSRQTGDFDVIVYGGGDGSCLPSDWTKVGPIQDPRLLALYYAVADAYVLPSLEDNFPCTLLESIASGTPCVTFDVGGCPEIVRNGQTGFVARQRDAGDLADCIDRVLTLSAAEGVRLRDSCREVAEKEYSLALQARRYAQLFDACVSGATEPK